MHESVGHIVALAQFIFDPCFLQRRRNCARLREQRVGGAADYKGWRERTGFDGAQRTDTRIAQGFRGLVSQISASESFDWTASRSMLAYRTEHEHSVHQGGS